MTCPVCDTEIPADQAPIGGIVLCPACLRSLVATTGDLATGAESKALDADQLKALKQRRAELRTARPVS